MHRYPDRVLIKLVAVCAVYCRFCFRRETGRSGRGRIECRRASQRRSITSAPVRAIWEVILTGGDPLILSPRRIAEATRALARDPACEDAPLAYAPARRRAGARNRTMARALRRRRQDDFVAVHANHPRELTPEAARAACRRLVSEGAMLVSQSVLLKGVNDDPETLDELMRAFVEARVKPYYLHHCDLAPGTAHWRVPIPRDRS